jgi:hypothetical protein
LKAALTFLLAPNSWAGTKGEHIFKYVPLNLCKCIPNELARLWVHVLFAENEIRQEKNTCTKQSSMVIDKQSRKGRIYLSTYDPLLAQRNRFKPRIWALPPTRLSSFYMILILIVCGDFAFFLAEHLFAAHDLGRVKQNEKSDFYFQLVNLNMCSPQNEYRKIYFAPTEP